ncbi:MAG TPA: hypothetical protein PKA98_10455 [Acidimicrobiales bacterium]|nr:hypothetical protein [Acidimicrobiales bacterium]
MPADVTFAWVPEAGARLTKEELVEILRALRALISGTEPDEPNRAHAVSIAYAVSTAMDREGGA